MMNSIFKIKSIGTTYVDSRHANQNFYDNKNLFAGSIHSSSSASTMFKSLITFDLCSLQSYPISSAYLCMYVKDVNSDTSYYSNNTLSIYRNTVDFDITKVTWNTAPLSVDPIHIIIPDNEVRNYIKINITSFVNRWLETDSNYGITLEANNFYSSLVKFASLSSAKPPLLYVEYQTAKMDYNIANQSSYHSYR